MIRPYAASDQEQLIDVWLRASQVAHPFLSKAFLESERIQIADHWIPLAETTIFESSGKVVGFLSLIGEEVGGLFVDPDHQRQGIGHALMDAALDIRPCLELNVFEGNLIGRSFYATYGFEEVGRKVNEPTGHPEIRLRFDARP